jgi:hypothetical protein
MRRDEIEAKVGALINAYVMASGPSHRQATQSEREKADATGRAIAAEIAIDTLFALHSIADSQVRIAKALELLAHDDDLLSTN